MTKEEMVRFYDAGPPVNKDCGDVVLAKEESVMDDEFRKNPSRFISLLFVSLLLIIHTADMLLTGHYIGDDWQSETFPIMRLTIRLVGIHAALWLSRLCIYSFLFAYFLNWRKRYWRYFLITCTLLYWAAMVSWLFTLGYVKWTAIAAEVYNG
jgi:hypothetical protein